MIFKNGVNFLFELDKFAKMLTTLSSPERRDLELVFAALYFPAIISLIVWLVWFVFLNSNYVLHIWFMKVQITNEGKVTSNKDWKHTGILFWEVTKQKTFTSSLFSANLDSLPPLPQVDSGESWHRGQLWNQASFLIFFLIISPPLCIPYTCTTHYSLWFNQPALGEKTLFTEHKLIASV